MPLKPPCQGEAYGSWTLVRRIGLGGHGEVWEARDQNGSRGAIKLLNKTKEIAYKRFRTEVHVMKTCGVSGVVPILDSNLPDEIGAARAWYVMPIGTPLVEHLKGKPARQRVEATLQVATTLAELHSRRIVHRDIKPANMLEIEDRIYIGDFGLVDFPEKEDLTGTKEDIGPRWAIAPEMRRHNAGDDASPADVYSLAKALWILLTENSHAFEGQYSAGSTVSIAKFLPDQFVAPLEGLLFDSTDHDPARRPAMNQFAERLRAWLTLESTFPERNRLEWIDVQLRLFPVALPDRTTWTNIDAIVTVLNVAGARSSMNHIFLPGGGGMDLTGARRSTREQECIELSFDGIVSVLKPARLMFDSFANEPRWSYFRLEAGALEPSDAYDFDTRKYGHEEVTDVGGHTYAPLSSWDEGEYLGERLPPNSRKLTRYFGGAFVIFQKRSPYNLAGTTYDGRHNRMTADEFRSYIARAQHVERR